VKVILFGATGMVGQAALRAATMDPGVEQVLTVGRSATGTSHPKVKELVHKDFLDFSSAEAQLRGYDACFWCLGVTSAGMSEADYTRVTVDYTAAAASVLARVNPGMTFVFISGAGSDSTGTSRTMWARVKGKGENAVLALPFKRAYAFRPAFIQPLHGITSRTRLYRLGYVLTTPLFPLLKLFPSYVTTTDQLAAAMLRAARHGAPKPVLENRDIVALAVDGFTNKT
jgi:uncharacterized protein YbjT (DUF2867 family)